MKKLLITLITLFTLSPLNATTVWRYEWEDTSPSPFFGQVNLLQESTAIGQGGLFPFTAEFRDNGFGSFAPRIFTLDPLGMWTIFSGTVGWDAITIYGDWKIGFGLNFFDYDMLVTGSEITAAWNNSVFENHEGIWSARGQFEIPDSGSTILLLGAALLTMVGCSSILLRSQKVA